MRYKCITKFYIEDIVIMSPNDIIVINDKDLFNITTGIDYHNIQDMDAIKCCLETLTDEDPKITSNVPITDVDRFEIITKKMVEVFKKKNHDYGNSFEESLNDEGIAASRIRLRDKWNRFVQLSRGRNAQVNEESIQDTLLDMANYAIMTIMWLDKQSNK